MRVDPSKIDAVRRRLASMFSGTHVRVVDPGDGGAVEFFLRPIGRGPRCVRISPERFSDHDTAEEIVPDSARAHIDTGSVLITNDGIEREDYLD